MAKMPSGEEMPKPEIAGVIAGGINKDAVKKAISSGADCLELRVDTFKNIDLSALRAGVKELKGFKKPIIITVRSAKEGGGADIADTVREEIFKTLTPVADMIDVELGSVKILKNVIDFACKHKKKTIVSYHNFAETPDSRTLKNIISRGVKAGGHIVKIATRVNSAEDARRLAGLLTDSRHELIVIGMGEKGVFTRVLFPLLGSRLTYGGVTGKTAPGQLSIGTLKKQFALYGF